jgi:hypothetical protein
MFWDYVSIPSSKVKMSEKKARGIEARTFGDYISVPASNQDVQEKARGIEARTFGNYISVPASSQDVQEKDVQQEGVGN